MRYNMATTTFRRFVVITILSSIAVFRVRGRIHIASHQRPIHSSRTNTSYRRSYRNFTSFHLNPNVSKTNDLIRCRSQQIHGRSTNSNRRLTLPSQRIPNLIIRCNVMTIQRHTCRMINTRNFNHHSSLLTNHVKPPMNRVLHRNTTRRPHVLRRRTRFTTRVTSHRNNYKCTIGHCHTTVSLMRSRRRISRHNLTHTN